jgi:hypothetical protein
LRGEPTYWGEAHAIWNASKPLEKPDTLIAMWFDG